MPEDLTDAQWLLISAPHRKKLIYLLSKGVLEMRGTNVILSFSPDGTQMKLKYEKTDPDIFISTDI